MPSTTYTSPGTALLMIDPYNDFMSKGGKLYDAVRETAQKAKLYEHLRQILAAMRGAGIPVFTVPHHRSRKDDYDGWLHVNPFRADAKDSQPFAEDSWGGEFHPEFGPQAGDTVIYHHWAQSGFANTDLDAQLKQHAIGQIVLVGLVANTCLESTGRYGMELGYHVTLVTDATAAFSAEGMHVAHVVNGPSYAHAILTTAELLAATA